MAGFQFLIDSGLRVALLIRVGLPAATQRHIERDLRGSQGGATLQIYLAGLQQAALGVEHLIQIGFAQAIAGVGQLIGALVMGQAASQGGVPTFLPCGGGKPRSTSIKASASACWKPI